MIKTISKISKNVWNKHDKVQVEGDVYDIFLDKSSSSGILHFTHEMHLLFQMKDGEIDFLGGDEIGVDFVYYSPEDWEWIKERYSLSDEFIKNEILAFEG